MKHYLKETGCACGRDHTVAIDEVVIGKGVIRRLPEFAAKYGAKRPFVLCDKNTYAAAGQAVCSLLEEAGISYSKYVLPQASLDPDEFAGGAAVMH